MMAKGELKMNPLLLEYKMKLKNISNEEMSKVLGIDASTFYRKKRGDSDFTRKEIQIMRSTLGLSQQEIEAIFFMDELA